MKGIILGINSYDRESELVVGDLVCPDDGYDTYYTIRKIDPRYGRQPDDADTPFKYFVAGRPSGKLMNYSRDELFKANIGFFDYNSYYNTGKKILLGMIHNDDLNYIKSKIACDYDMGFSELKKIKQEDMIELIFDGEVVMKEYDSHDQNVKNLVKYFKINKPK